MAEKNPTKPYAGNDETKPGAGPMAANASSDRKPDDEAKQGETGREPADKAKATAATPEAPYPSQAHLDAMRDGAPHKRKRDMKASGGGDYQTR